MRSMLEEVILRGFEKIGFVILNYNAWEMTKALAEKVAGFECISHVVVVDNVSTDDSFIQLKAIANDSIIVVQSEKNGGYSYGNNFGARICKEVGVEIMFISNPDVDIELEDVQKIVQAFKTEGYSILTGIEYDSNNNMALPPIWRMNRYRDDLIQCFVFGRRFLNTNKGEALNKGLTIQPIEMMKGSFFAVRLCDFFEIKGFDEGVFLFCEERILAKKMADAGKKIGLVTGAKYRHDHSATISRVYKKVGKQIKLLYRSRLYYNIKYNRIGKVKELLLRCAMLISMLEYGIQDEVNALKFKLGRDGRKRSVER